MNTLLLVGKILFSYLFVTSGINHFKNLEVMTGYANYKKLPFAKFGVLASGLLLIVAPILVIAGIATTWSLVALAAFLTATALIFHPYWKETDPNNKMNEMIAFNKELSLIGSILAWIALIN